MINVDEIDRDVAVPHTCFTRSGIANLNLLEAKNFRTTDTVETDGARHDQSSLLEAYARPGAPASAAGLIPKPRQIGTVASRATTTYSAACNNAWTGLRFGAKPFFSSVSSIVL